jgi:hypothetical protein
MGQEAAPDHTSNDTPEVLLAHLGTKTHPGVRRRRINRSEREGYSQTASADCLA